MVDQPHLGPDDMVVQDRQLPSGEIDEELMALDANAGDVLGLDPVGTRIWNRAAQPVRVADLLEWIVETHDVDAETARAEVLPFLDELVAAKLLKRTS